MTNVTECYTITDAELDQLDAISKAATPGDWFLSTNPKDCDIKELYDDLLKNSGGNALWFATVNNGEVCTAMCGNGPNSENNARFVVIARKAVPDLVQEVRRLKANAKHFVWCGVPSDFLILPLIFEDDDKERVLVNMLIAPCRSITHDNADLYSVRFQVSLDDDEDFEPFDTEVREGLKNALDWAEAIARGLGFLRSFDTIERPETGK